MSGAVFLSDTNSRQIYRLRSLTSGRQLLDNAQVVAGTGEQCVPFDEARCGDGGKAVEATLMSPRGEFQGHSVSTLTVEVTVTEYRCLSLFKGCSAPHIPYKISYIHLISIRIILLDLSVTYTVTYTPL